MNTRRKRWRPKRAPRLGAQRRNLREAKSRTKGVSVDKLASRLLHHESLHPFQGQPQKPVIENIEDVFAEFANTIGGRRGSEFHDAANGEKNADFVLPDEKLIIELKTLEAPLNYSEEGSVRVREIFDKLRVPISEFVPFLLGNGPMPMDVAAEMFRVTRQNLRSDVRKAYKQLQSTWAVIGDPTYRRVLILANSGVSILPEINIFSMATGVLAKDDYWSKGVDAAVFYSGNVAYKPEFSERHYRTWVPMFQNEEGHRSFGRQLDHLGTRFLTFLAARGGEPDQAPLFFDAWNDVLELYKRSNPMRPR